MKAIGYETAGPVDAPDAPRAFDAPRPEIGPQDLAAMKFGAEFYQQNGRRFHEQLVAQDAPSLG